MKKNMLIIVLLIVLVLVLSACSDKKKETSQVTVKMTELYENIAKNVDLQPMVEMDFEYFNSIYISEEIDASTIADYAFYEAEDPLSVDMIILMKLGSEEEISTFKQSLENIKLQKINANANGYNPEQFDIASKGLIETKGDFIYLIMSNQQQRIKEIINKYIK